MAWNAAVLDAEWPFGLLGTSFTLTPEATALLIIDMQAGDLVMDPASELAQQYPGIAQYWNERLQQGVLPTIQRLIRAFRAHGGRIIYTRNGCMTPSGVELAPRLRSKITPGQCYRGLLDYDIDPEIAPAPEDLVVDKLTSGAFTQTCLDHALRNMGIRGLVITGVLTDMCIAGTARTGSELGYDALICEDACATFTQRAHDDALLLHARVFGRVAQGE